MSRWQLVVGLAILAFTGRPLLAWQTVSGPADYFAVEPAAFDAASSTATASPVMGCEAQPCAACSDCCDLCCDPLWTVQAGAVILNRSSPDAVLLQNLITGDTIADTSDFDSPWAAGVDATARRRLNACRSVEARFFMVDGWNAETSLTTPVIWNFPTDPPLFGLGFADIDISYSTRLYSTEINVRQETSDRFTWLVGFRWVELYEDLSFDTDFGGIFEATIDFATANRVYGGQVGADVALWSGGALRVDSIFKAGLLGNVASQEFLVAQEIGPSFVRPTGTAT